MSPGKTRLALLTCMLLNCSFQQITSRQITSFATEVERKQKKKKVWQTLKPQQPVITNEWLWFPENSAGTHKRAPPLHNQPPVLPPSLPPGSLGVV